MAKAKFDRSPTVVSQAPIPVTVTVLAGSATGRRYIATVKQGWSIVAAKFVSGTTIALDPADYWTFSVTSTGGTVPLTGTKATTTVMTAGTIYSVDGLPAGQALAADTVLELDYAKSGNGTDLSAVYITCTVWLQPA